MKRLIAIGDSITLGHWDPDGGWIAQIRRQSDQIVMETRREHYAAVYNLGISSNTSTDVLARYQREVDARHDPDDGAELFVAVAVGINDSQIDLDDDGNSVVALDIYASQMRQVLDLAVRDASGRVVVVGLTPVDETLTKPVWWKPRREYRNAVISQYNDVARETATEAGARFVDLFSRLGVGEDLWLDWDGVHLRHATHKQIGALVAGELMDLGWGRTAS